MTIANTLYSSAPLTFSFYFTVASSLFIHFFPLSLFISLSFPSLLSDDLDIF